MKEPQGFTTEALPCQVAVPIPWASKPAQLVILFISIAIFDFTSELVNATLFG
jgi:hypothetical protein